MKFKLMQQHRKHSLRRVIDVLSFLSACPLARSSEFLHTSLTCPKLNLFHGSECFCDKVKRRNVVNGETTSLKKSVMAGHNKEISCIPTTELTPDVYERWRESSLGNLTESIERRLMMEEIGDLRGKSVLEIGCGDGDFAFELSLKISGASEGRYLPMMAVDASEAMIDSARQRASEQGVDNVIFSVGMAEDLPFEDEMFDVVVAQTILCFVKDPLAVFREIFRVLKPGGYLVIGELGKWSTWAFARRLRSWCGSSLWKKGFFRTPAELREVASIVGLDTAGDSIKGAIYFPRWFPVARLLAPYDKLFGRLSHIGAAFYVMKATKKPRKSGCKH